jgi:hypothetical protein
MIWNNISIYYSLYWTICFHRNEIFRLELNSMRIRGEIELNLVIDTNWSHITGFILKNTWFQVFSKNDIFSEFHTIIFLSIIDKFDVLLECRLNWEINLSFTSFKMM